MFPYEMTPSPTQEDLHEWYPAGSSVKLVAADEPLAVESWRKGVRTNPWERSGEIAAGNYGAFTITGVVLEVGTASLSRSDGSFERYVECLKVNPERNGVVDEDTICFIRLTTLGNGIWLEDPVHAVD